MLVVNFVYVLSKIKLSVNYVFGLIDRTDLNAIFLSLLF